MKNIKLFESFENNEELKEDLSHLFMQFEDDGWQVSVDFTKIVPDRDDWTGNLTSTKVRNVWGNKFIDYHKHVIMSRGDLQWHAKSALVVNVSKISYLKEINSNIIEAHWKKIDQMINGRIPTIKIRAEKLEFELWGVYGKWFQLGPASHSDFESEPHYKYETVIDSISFAFFYK